MRPSLKHKLHHYFLPHESNNYKARLLHAGVIFYYIVLLFVLQLSKNFIRNFSPDILGYATDITVEKTLELVNQNRQQAGLAPLTLSAELTAAATQKAADMFGKDYWAHVSPTGATPWQFISGNGYQYVYAGENLAKSFDTVEEMVAAWMDSPTHRANILKPEYTEIGLAVMNGKLKGEETTLVVQEFGTRAVAAAPVRNTTPVPAVPVVVSQVNQLGKTIFSLRISKTFSLILAEFLLVILIVDSIYIWRHKTARISSHSLAHIIFFATLIGAMMVTGAGVIL
jgi:hypothetical protein